MGALFVNYDGNIESPITRNAYSFPTNSFWYFFVNYCLIMQIDRKMDVVTDDGNFVSQVAK